MSKAVLFLAVPAVAGLVVWNLALSSEISDLRAQIDAAPAAERAAEPAKGAGAAASASEPRSRDAVRALQQVSDLASRIAEVEKRLPAAPAAAADGTDGSADGAPAAGTAAPGDPATYSNDAFRLAVAKVLDDRDAQRRRERMERGAEARARFLLRDLTVTDAQREAVAKAVLASMEKVEQIRDDPALADEQRREDVQAAFREQVESLAAILDAQSMEIVRQRAENGRRTLRGQDGGNDGAGGNGGGGRPGRNRGN